MLLASATGFLYLIQLPIMREVVYLLITLVAIILAVWLKPKIEKIKKKLTYSVDKNDIEPQKAINEQLLELRIRTDAIRTNLLKFHNGGDYFDDHVIKKMSVTNVSTHAGVTDEVQTRQNLPLTLFPEYLEAAFDKNVCVYLTKDFPNNYVKNYFMAQGTEAFVSQVIEIKSKKIGILSIHFDNENKIPKDIEEIVKHFKESIEFIIGNNNAPYWPKQIK